jgi:hypothetical protein
MRLAPVFLPTDGQARHREELLHLVERGQPDRVFVRHLGPLGLGQRTPFLQREGEPPAGGERVRDRLEQRPLVAEGEHRLEQQHHVEGARR